MGLLPFRNAADYRQRRVLCEVSALLLWLLDEPQFAPHATAIEQHSAVAASLVRLLAPGVEAAATALQPPTEQGSAERNKWKWQDVKGLAVVLAAQPLAAALASHLAADGPGIGTNALQLLQPACQLLSWAPLDSWAEPAGEQPAALVDACWLLIHAVSGILMRSTGCESSIWFSPRAQRASQLLLQLPEHLTPLLLWREKADEPSPAAVLACTADAMSQALKLLLWLALPPADINVLLGRPVDSLPEWQPWCAAASALLRSLPALAELAQRCGGELPRAVAGLVGSSFPLSSGAGQVATCYAFSCNTTACGRTPQLAALCHATFQLHTDMCRAVHWSQTAQPHGVFEPALLLALSCAMTAAAQVPSALPATAAWLPAMAAAHCEAVQTLLSVPGRVQQLAAGQPITIERSIAALAAALAALPQPAALDARLPVLLAEMTAASLQVGKGVASRHCRKAQPEWQSA